MKNINSDHNICPKSGLFHSFKCILIFLILIVMSSIIIALHSYNYYNKLKLQYNKENTFDNNSHDNHKYIYNNNLVSHFLKSHIYNENNNTDISRERKSNIINKVNKENNLKLAKISNYLLISK